MGDLQDRIALVLGGAAGIGLASCRALAAEGAKVIVADRDGEAASHAAAAITANGGDATAYQVDFASLDQLGSLFRHIKDTHGRLHIFFSNVGVRGANGFDVTPEAFDEVIALNLKHHFFATQMATPLMRPCAPQASIIYMSSGAGLKFFGRSPLYSISKAALIMMMRSFARHLGPEGVRVNALCPGPVDTGFPTSSGVDLEAHSALVEQWVRTIPLKRIAQPSDVADVVAYLASDRSSYLTGLALPVEGGLLA